MTRRRKWLIVIAALVVALLAAAAGASWFLLGTEAGARWTIARVGAFLPGTVEIGSLSGPLRGPLELRDVVFHTDAADVRIRRVLLEWRLRELLRRRLDIVTLVAEDVRIVRGLPEPVQETRQGPLPDVHFSINIVVREARVSDLVVVGPAGDEQLRLDTIVLESTARGETVRVDRLVARGPRLDLEATGWLRPQGDYPLDVRGRWEMRPETLPRLRGEARLSGSFEQLRVEHRLAAPFASTADVVVHRPMRDLVLEGSVAVSGLDPRLFRPDLPAMTVSASARLAGPLERLRATGDARVVAPEYGTLTARYDVSRSDAEVRLTRVAIGVADSAAEAVVRGTVVVADPPRFDLTAEWSRLAWPLTGPAVVRSGSGSGSAEGTPQGYRFRLAGEVSGPQIPRGSWTVRGRGTTAGADLAVIEGRVLRAAVSGAGRVDWTPDVAWDLALEARGVDPSALVAGWPGALQVSGRTQGRVTDAGPEVEIAPLAARGRLRGSPLIAAGAIEYSAGAVALEDIAGSWGAARFALSGSALSGSAGDRLDLRWSADVPNVGLLMDGLGGAVRGEGRVRGTTGAPHIVGSITGRDLAHPAASAARVEARVDADLAPTGRIAAELTAGAPVLNGLEFERAAFNVAGTRDRHEARVVLAAPERALDARATGGLDAGYAWSGTLDALTLADTRAGRWQLVQRAPLDASAERVRAATLCLASGAARVCGSGRWEAASGWGVEAEFSQVGLDRARALLPDGVALAGAASGRLDAAADAAGVLTARAELLPLAGTVTYPGPASATETVRFTGAHARAEVDARGTALVGGVELPGIGTARVDLMLAGFRSAGMPPPRTPLAGSVSAHFGDLSFLRAFIPQVTRVLGRIDADVRVGGTIGDPVVVGDARLVDLGADIPLAGLELRNGSVTARSEGGRALVLDGSIRSGPGRLTLNGSIPPAPTRETPLRVELGGERFLAVARDDARVLVSPDLTFTHAGGPLVIRGTIDVPEATIEVRELPSGAVPVSEDVVFVDRAARESAAEEPTLAIDARVDVRLGDKISFKAFGFDGSPAGELTLVEEPGRPPEAHGVIRLVRGTFKAYGQDLTLMPSELRFGGPPTNPALDIEAFRRATANPEIVAGVRVSGFAQSPQVTLWSDPPMPQTDQLAYLVLGRPLDEAGSSEGSLLANAAASLGVRGGNLLARRIGARFGLEEARIETRGGGYQDASLFIGRYLSPRLYVAYGVGLFHPSNVFRLRYALGRKWTLQAETGEATGADLLYSPQARPIQRNLADPEAAAEAPRVPDEEGTGGFR